MGSKLDPKSIADLVRSEREKKGWSQEKLGQKARLSTNTVFSIEQGTPSFRRSRDKISAVLGIELDD